MRALVAMVLAVGCGSAEPVAPGVRRQGTTWKIDVAPALQASCSGCHGGDDPAAGLRTDDYFAVIGRAQAGDPASRLLAVAGDATHASLTNTFALLRTWVVADDLGYETSTVHGPGLMNPADPTFHGTVVAKALGWNLASCSQCHGTDYAGGTSGVTCQSCHDGGLSSCTGCHGQPPQTGAHVAHVGAAKLDCTECHVKPTLVSDVGHLKSGPATIHFGTLATAQSATPSYDAAAKTCAGSYCHGAAFSDTAATQRTPSWTGGAAQAACGSCHGLPPSGHQATGDPCVSCHRAVVDGDRRIVDAARHVNGTVDFGVGPDTCTSCHGQPPATGSHVAHTEAPHGLAAPVACGDCHVVPVNVSDPGHLVAPAQVALRGVRATGGGQTAPTWDAASQTCANVHCHGGGQPTWGAGVAAISCGSCHGIPPATEAHPPGLVLADCVRCHSATVEAGGAIKVGGAHMNGVVDVDD